MQGPSGARWRCDDRSVQHWVGAQPLAAGCKLHQGHLHKQHCHWQEGGTSCVPASSVWLPDKNWDGAGCDALQQLTDVYLLLPTHCSIAADTIHLEGMSSYEAATHCASLMAAQRAALARNAVATR